jgi:GT2 family glycosyltransferase
VNGTGQSGESASLKQSDESDQLERMNQPPISVVVINWNSGTDLAGCLPSVLAQTLPPIEMVIIDNASSDDSPVVGRQALEAAGRSVPCRVTWVMNRRNEGFSRAANQGIGATTGDWVLLLNPDVILAPAFLDEAWSALRARPEAGSLGGKVLRFDHRTIDTTGQFIRADGRVRERGYGEADRGQYEQSGEVFSVCGAVALYRRVMLEDVAVNGEYFDEDFFAFYEDADLGWRAQRRGWSCWYQPTAVAYHARGGTNRSGRHMWARWQMPRRPLQIQFHILLNRHLMLVKNLSAGTALRHALLLLWADGVDLAYLLVMRPRLLAWAPAAAELLRRALDKRRMIASRRAVPRTDAMRG